MKDRERIPKRTPDQVNASKELQEEPFLIRGHHLAVYRSLPSRSSPEDIASATLYIRKKGYPPYVVDTIGETEEQQNEYYRNFTDLLKTYESFEDTQPVKLVAGKKDALCAICTFGKHCNLKDATSFVNPQYRPPSIFDVPDAAREDARSIAVFKEKAEELKKSTQIVPDTAIFSDAEPREVKSLIITAKDFKTVLRKIPEINLR